MEHIEWSRHMSELFLDQYDPGRTLLQWRNFVPGFVLRCFCTTDRLKSMPWHIDEQSDADTLVIYDPKTQRFDKRHWSECFGKSNIYEHYFDNLKQQCYNRHGFRAFQVLQRIDHDIFAGLTEQTEAIWQINEGYPRGEIKLRRGDFYYLRKMLFLMTSVRNRDRNQHLMARDPLMQDARNRRKKFMEAHSLDHARDLWLRNADIMLHEQHFDIATNNDIFDLDREDYRANARERFVVFWEAGPGEEFVLTDNAFGCFEGGQIGARKKPNVNLTPRDHEEKTYTRDYMWHQLFVLSPKLVLALCHGSLIHPELTKQQRRRWGLQRSFLEGLPHPIDSANHYYKDLAKGEASFLNNEGWTIPPEVEKLFGPSRWDGKVVAIEHRENDQLIFPIEKLSSEQVNQVNLVLLQNQSKAPPVQSVSFRPPSSYRSLLDSLALFRETDWSKYTDVKQNTYESLEKRLATYLSRTDEALSYGTAPTIRPSPTVFSPHSGSPAPDNRKPIAEKKKKQNPSPPPVDSEMAAKVEVVTAGQGRKERRYHVTQSSGAENSHKRERSNPPLITIPTPASHMPPIPEQRRAVSSERVQPPRRAPSKGHSAEPPSRRSTISQGQPPVIQQQQTTSPPPPPPPQIQPVSQPQRRGASSDRRFSVHAVEQSTRSEHPPPISDHRRPDRVEGEPAKAELKPSPESRQQQAPMMESQPSKQSAPQEWRKERSVSASRRHSVASHQEHRPIRVELQPSPIPHPSQVPQQPPPPPQPNNEASPKRPVVTEKKYTEQSASAPQIENAQPVLESSRTGLAENRYYSSPGTILEPTKPQVASVPVPEPKIKKATENGIQPRQLPPPSTPASAPGPIIQPPIASSAPKPAQTSPTSKPAQTATQAPSKPASHNHPLNVDSLTKLELAKAMIEQPRIILDQRQDVQRRLLEERVGEQKALEQQVPMNGYNRSRDRSNVMIYLADPREDAYDRHDHVSDVSSKSSSTGSSGSSGSSGSRSSPASGHGSESRGLEKIAECDRDISPHKRAVQPIVHISSKSQPPSQKYPSASHTQIRARVNSLKYENTYGVNDAEVDGSMIVEVDDDQEAWEDEGYGEIEEIQRPRKPIVRFASPKPSPRKASVSISQRARHPSAGHGGHPLHHLQAHHPHSQMRRSEY